MTSTRQKLINRMVDGELTQNEQGALLTDCEENAGWRELALAYVESQALSTELKSFVESEKHARFGVQQTDSKLTASSWNSWSLAAAIMLSLTFGYGLGWSWPDGTSAVENSLTGPAEFDKVAGSAASMQFTVSDPATSELRQIDLPVVKASDLGPNWQRQLGPTLPEDLLREMRAGGLNVHQTRTVTPIRLPDGRRVVVPIDYYVEQPFQ